MTSFPFCPRLKGPKGHILAAKIEVPILAALICGLVEFMRLGWSQDDWLYTYAPVLGGIAASTHKRRLAHERPQRGGER